MLLSERDFILSISRLWKRIEFLDFGEEFSNPVSVSPSVEFISLALDDDTTFEELYLCGLRNRDFNILLSGYSYFQFNRSEHGLRYAYYPNPLLGASHVALAELAERKEYVDEGIVSMEEYLQEISELRFAIQPPPIRYEFDPDAYVELSHPSSHFHIGFHSENRWPSNRVLSPEAFGLLISKLYFGEKWRSAGLLDLGGVEYSADGLLERARAESRLLGDEFFSELEGRSFHFC